VIVHSNIHIAKQMFMEWFLPSSSKDLGRVIKYTKYMTYYHIISVKPTTVVKSSWWLLIATLPPASWNSRHSERKKKSAWNYLTTVLIYAVFPEIMSAPYLEHTRFGLPTEILIFLWIQHSAVSSHFLIPQCSVSTPIFKSHVKLY